MLTSWKVGGGTAAYDLVQSDKDVKFALTVSSVLS